MSTTKVLINTLLELFQTTCEDIMEKSRERRPVHFNFNNEQEMVDLYIRINLKYFLLKLLYTPCEMYPISTQDTARGL